MCESNHVYYVLSGCTLEHSIIRKSVKKATVLHIQVDIEALVFHSSLRIQRDNCNVYIALALVAVGKKAHSL